MDSSTDESTHRTSSNAERLLSLGSRLAQARKDVGLNQTQAGQRIGVPKNTISRWETGQNDPKFTQVARAAEIYGVSLDWMCGKAAHRSGLRPGYTIIDVRLMETVDTTLRTGGRLSDLLHLADGPALPVAYDIPEAVELVHPKPARDIHARVKRAIAELARRSR